MAPLVGTSAKFWVVVLPAVTLTLTVELVNPDFEAVTLRLEPGVTLLIV